MQVVSVSSKKHWKLLVNVLLCLSLSMGKSNYFPIFFDRSNLWAVQKLKSLENQRQFYEFDDTMNASPLALTNKQKLRQ